MSNWEEIRKYIAKSNLPEPIKQHLLMQYSKPHPANLKAQQKALHEKPTVYYYGSGEKKTVKEVEAAKTTSKSKSKPKAKGVKKVKESEEFREEYNRLRRELMEKVASGELTPEEAQRALRSIRGLGTYYGTVEGARRKGQISKEKYKEYVSKFKNIKLPELIYGKVPKGWVSEWDDPARYVQLRHQLQNFYQKYGKYLSKEDRETIERLLEMHFLPGDLDEIIRDTELEILSIIHRPGPKEKRLRKFELEHQPSLVKAPFSMGEAPAKISYEELFGKGVKTPDIVEYIPGMEFLQMSYQASKKLATTGLKLEPTWEEKVEKAVERQKKLLEEKKKLKSEFNKLNKELANLEKMRNEIVFLSGLFKGTTNPEAMEALAKYRAGLISGDTVVSWWNGYKFEKITVAELDKKYREYIEKTNNFNNKIEEFRTKQEKLKAKAGEINRQIEEINKIVREGPGLFERSLLGSLTSVLNTVEEQLNKATGGFWGEYWKYTPAGVSWSLMSSFMLGKPTQISFTPIEMLRIPVGFASAVESTITEGVPGLLSLVGLPVKPLTHVPDIGEAFIGKIAGSKRGEKEYEYLFKHPGFLVGSLIGEYVVGEALAKLLGPPVKYVAGKGKPIASRVGRTFKSTASDLVKKLLPHSYEEYKAGKGPFSYLFGEKSFPSFVKERYVKPTKKWLEDLLTTKETKYFKEEFGRVKSKGFTKQMPEGKSIIAEFGEIDVLKTPISKQEYLKLKSRLNEAIHGLVGDYVKFGGEVGRGEVLVKSNVRWEATNLLNAIRRGRAGIGKVEYYLTTKTPALEDFLRRYIYPAGFEGQERFVAGLERFMFTRKGNKILFSRIIETPNLLKTGEFSSEFIPKYAYQYLSSGFFGEGLSSGGKPTGGLFVKTLGKEVVKTSKLSPIIGLTSKIETKLKNILSPLSFTKTVSEVKAKTVPKVKTEPLLGLKTDQILKPIEIPSISIKAETNQLGMQLLPNLIGLGRVRQPTLQLLPPLVGASSTVETKPKAGIRPFSTTIPGIGEITGIKAGTTPIESIKIKTPDFTELIAPPTIPETPEIPTIPTTPTPPIMPPIPRLLGAGYPGRGGSIKRSRAWWSTWFKPLRINIGGLDIGLLMPKKRKKKRKKRRKKKKLR